MPSEAVQHVSLKRILSAISKQSYETCQNLFVTFGRRFVHFKISLKNLRFFFPKFFNKTRTSILVILDHTFLTNRQKLFPLDEWVESLAMIMN